MTTSRPFGTPSDHASRGLVALSLLAAGALGACGGSAETPTVTPGVDSGVSADVVVDAAPVDNGPPPPSGLPLLGGYHHTPDSVNLRVIGTDADGLNNPSDVAINPEATDQIWVTNRATPSIVVYTGTGTDSQAASLRTNPRQNGGHFLAHPAGLAFGATGMFATAPDENQVTQPTTPSNFMGPSLWTTNLSIFDGGTRSHLDMLHNSPSSVGIAWDRANIYWIFDSAHHSLTRYDFHQPHELGGEDHSDGEIARFAEGEVSRIPDVVSHLDMDHATGMLYVADTGNHRIAVLDTASGIRGASMTPNYDGGRQYRMMMAALTTLVDNTTSELQAPSGIALGENTVYVTDNATSRIYAFDRTGHLLDWLDLSTQVEANSLMGIALDTSGTLYVVDALGNRVFAVSALAR